MREQLASIASRWVWVSPTLKSVACVCRAEGFPLRSRGAEVARAARGIETRSRVRPPVRTTLAGPVAAQLGTLIGMAAIAFWFEHHAGAFSGPSQFGFTVSVQPARGATRRAGTT